MRAARDRGSVASMTADPDRRAADAQATPSIWGHPPPGWSTAALLVVAAALLAAGLTLPILEIEAFLLFRDPVSILDGVAVLWRDGEWLIAGIVLAFSAVFPVAKILAALALWLRLRRRHAVDPAWATALKAIGRWSMLDVFVVALAIFSIKASALGEARVEMAIGPFLGAIAATAYATHRLERLARTAPAPEV